MTTDEVAEPPPLHVVAECGPVRIRRKLRSDALNDFQWRRDPEMARFDGTSPIESTFSQFLERLEYDIAFGGHDRQMYAIDSAEGDHIGNIMWYNASGDRLDAEFGIGIGRAEWRDRGAGTAATIGFLRFLWSTTSFRRIYLHTLAWNERAQRSFAKAGFAPTGTILRDGESYVRMEVRREWWLMWDDEGRFPPAEPPPAPGGAA